MYFHIISQIISQIMPTNTAQIYMMIIDIAIIAALSSVELGTTATPVAADPKRCAGNRHDSENGDLDNGNPHDAIGDKHHAEGCCGAK
jgi:hypothetical protein